MANRSTICPPYVGNLSSANSEFPRHAECIYKGTLFLHIPAPYTIQPPGLIMESPSSSEALTGTLLASESAKRVLRKIDWQLIPLLFVTYNLNFMDKTILSSAAVLGLSEDTVYPDPPRKRKGHQKTLLC